MPDGERYLDLEARVAAALAEHREPMLWFTHAGVIRALHHLISGIDREDALRMPVPYATPMRF
jgi:broad specificity phosphatase PhoE